MAFICITFHLIEYPINCRNAKKIPNINFIHAFDYISYWISLWCIHFNVTFINTKETRTDVGFAATVQNVRVPLWCHLTDSIITGRYHRCPHMFPIYQNGPPFIISFAKKMPSDWEINGLYARMIFERICSFDWFSLVPLLLGFAKKSCYCTFMWYMHFDCDKCVGVTLN